MGLIQKAIAWAIIVGLITLVIEAILYEREVSANIRKERPFYE
jgi:TM2 domain-containing membrane protein YozV